MLISDSHKFIFFHIPKTAGVTIISRLRQYHTRSDDFINGTYMHCSFKHFKRLPIFSQVKDYFKFAFVRNPYDHLFSLFSTWIYLKHLPKNTDFNHFVIKKLQKVLPGQLRFDKIKPSDAKNGFINAHIYDNGKNMMTFTGNNEFFEEDFEKICNILNIEIPEKINRSLIIQEPKKCPRFAVSKMPKHCYKYLDKYTSQAIKIVHKVYAKDFEYFNYPMLDPKDFPELL